MVVLNFQLWVFIVIDGERLSKDTSEIVKGTGGSIKKKRLSNYYFWVVNEVKNSFSLYTDKQILNHFLQDYTIARPNREHFIECFHLNLVIGFAI